MKVVAIASMKGGVGKTTTAVNLAYEASRAGVRTLVWDLDPQGATTYTFRIRPKVKGGAEALLHRRRPLERHLRGTDFPDLDLLPADFSERHMDLVLDGFKRPSRRFARILREVEGEFDLAVLDCPPGGGRTIEGAAEAADVVLVPLVPTTLAVRSFEQLLRVIRDVADAAPEVIPFFSMVDRRKRLHQDLVDQVRRDQPSGLSIQVPNSADVERMALRRAPVSVYAPRSAGAVAFEIMWYEIADRLGIPFERPAD